MLFRSVCHGALDLIFRKVGAAGDGDVLLPAGAQILGRHLDHAVDVDVKGDLDLRLGGETASDAVELELAQALVVAGKVALTLQHVDFHAGLCGYALVQDLIWSEIQPYEDAGETGYYLLTNGAGNTTYQCEHLNTREKVNEAIRAVWQQFYAYKIGRASCRERVSSPV